MSNSTESISDRISPPPPAVLPTFVVGIGASAGGLEALERFFDHVPKDSGMAFVLVQHLSPDFKSLMDELLARHTTLPIRLVEDGMTVAPDHVYLIPPKKEMIISEGRLLLSERDRGHELSLPIDVFFRSLAQRLRPTRPSPWCSPAAEAMGRAASARFTTPEGSSSCKTPRARSSTGCPRPRATPASPTGCCPPERCRAFSWSTRRSGRRALGSRRASPRGRCRVRAAPRRGSPPSTRCSRRSSVSTSRTTSPAR